MPAKQFYISWLFEQKTKPKGEIEAQRKMEVKRNLISLHLNTTSTTRCIYANLVCLPQSIDSIYSRTMPLVFIILSIPLLVAALYKDREVKVKFRFHRFASADDMWKYMCAVLCLCLVTMMRSDAVFAVSFKLNWLNFYLFYLIKFIYRYFRKNVKLCENRHAFYSTSLEKKRRRKIVVLSEI